jgi:hypothetical protein
MCRSSSFCTSISDFDFFEKRPYRRDFAGLVASCFVLGSFINARGDLRIDSGELGMSDGRRAEDLDCNESTEVAAETFETK